MCCTTQLQTLRTSYRRLASASGLISRALHTSSVPLHGLTDWDVSSCAKGSCNRLSASSALRPLPSAAEALTGSPMPMLASPGTSEKMDGAT